MDIDEKTLSFIIKDQDKKKKFVLYLDDKSYPLEDFSITKSSVPVRKPTVRGGICFSDVTAYKIKATTRDFSLLPMISKLMLGPNEDFRPLEIKTEIIIDQRPRTLTLITHLTNTMNNKTKLELNLVVDKTNLS